MKQNCTQNSVLEILVTLQLSAPSPLYHIC